MKSPFHTRNSPRTAVSFNPALVFKLLISLCFFFLIYISYVFFIQQQIELDSRLPPHGGGSRGNEISKPYEYYMEQFKRRDIFGLIPPETTDQDIARITSSFAQNLKIVGIILGHPSEAIIEDALTKQTYFLNPGDLFKEAKTQSILEGRVLFQYKGKIIQIVQPE
jgi:hypothetical protein